MGYQVHPGISDGTLPNPSFNLTPAATVDEGNNWINIAWGPLAMTNPATNVALGNYAPASAASPVVNYIPSTATTNYNVAPSLDFFGNARKTNNAVDAGAIEFAATTGGGGGGGGQGRLSITSATNGTLGSVLGVPTFTFTIPAPRAPVTSVVTVTNSGSAPLQITAENLLLNVGGLYTVPANTCSFTTPLAVGGTCTFSVGDATPANPPGLPDIGALAVVNDGSGTIGGSTPLALVAR